MKICRKNLLSLTLVVLMPVVGVGNPGDNPVVHLSNALHKNDTQEALLALSRISKKEELTEQVPALFPVSPFTRKCVGENGQVTTSAANNIVDILFEKEKKIRAEKEVVNGVDRYRLRSISFGGMLGSFIGYSLFSRQSAVTLSALAGVGIGALSNYSYKFFLNCKKEKLIQEYLNCYWALGALVEKKVDGNPFAQGPVFDVCGKYIQHVLYDQENEIPKTNIECTSDIITKKMCTSSTFESPMKAYLDIRGTVLAPITQKQYHAIQKNYEGFFVIPLRVICDYESTQQEGTWDSKGGVKTDVFTLLSVSETEKYCYYTPQTNGLSLEKWCHKALGDDVDTDKNSYVYREHVYNNGQEVVKKGFCLVRPKTSKKRKSQ